MFKWLFTAAFVAFAIFNVIILWEPGVLSVFPPFKEPWQFQMFVDIGVGVSLVNLWVLVDLKKLGRSLWWWVFFVVLTILSGSMGPLFYVMLRSWGVFGKPLEVWPKEA